MPPHPFRRFSAVRRPLLALSIALVHLCAPVPAAAESTATIRINPNARRSVGGVSTFDRAKFITIHASHTESDWDGGQQGAQNAVADVRDDFLNGRDVYLGRDSGYVTYHAKSTIAEDPARPGWPQVTGGNNSMGTQGTNARASYDNRPASVKAFAWRSDQILVPQFEPFWPDGTLTNRGWAFSRADTTGEPLGTASGFFVGHFLQNFFSNGGLGGPPKPKWVEVINEPDYPLLDDTATPADPALIWRFHNSMADQIRALNPEVLIGGYCAAFPDLDRANLKTQDGSFGEWTGRWKPFMDASGSKMDFWSIHLYDFPVFGTQRTYRKGANLEATFDMIEQYSWLALGTAKPFVVSEYGAQTHNYNRQGWSAVRDWQVLKSVNSMVMSFMDRPHLILKTIPFIVVKAEWGRTTVPYGPRLMRQSGEPAGATGPWIYSELEKFYSLWADVKGTRVDTTSSNPDVQLDAYANGNKLYVILTNLHSQSSGPTFLPATVDLAVVERHGNAVQSVRTKHLYWNGSAVVLDDSTATSAPGQVQLQSEATMILEYTFADALDLDRTSTETKTYATTYFQPIVAGTPGTFHLNGVPTGAFGAAVLRLGIGRAPTRSRQPTIQVNGVTVPVPANIMGLENDTKTNFFGVIDVPVPFGLIEANNVVTVAFPDSGGHISSVALRSHVFSTDVRGAVADAPPVLLHDLLDLTAYAGQPVHLQVKAGGAELTYQWYKDGVLLPGESRGVLSLPSFDAAMSGQYECRVANRLGEVRSRTATLSSTSGIPSKLSNLSVRGFSGAGADVLTGGFVPVGAQKRFLIRSIGPGLVRFGVNNVMSDPVTNVRSAAGQLVAENDNWPSTIAATASRLGAFALVENSLDAGMDVALDPGVYTAATQGASAGDVGTILLEIYDAGTADSGELSNLSARAQVESGGSLIVGLVVEGTTSATVMIRAVGPSLAAFGLDPLPDPTLEITRLSGTQAVIMSNTGWKTLTNADQIAATAAKLGAFALNGAGGDSVTLVTLPPGVYTATIRSASNQGRGVALAEFYLVR